MNDAIDIDSIGFIVCSLGEVVTFLIFEFWQTQPESFFQNSHKTVILRACDFIDLSLEVLDFKQNRHPERSASQIYRLTEGFWRGVEGPRGCLLA